MSRPLSIITTHKNTDFDALASVVAAGMLYPQAVTVLPQQQNPNTRAFLSLHKDLFEYCLPDHVDYSSVDRLVVVDTNGWQRLDKMERLREKSDLEIHLWTKAQRNPVSYAQEGHENRNQWLHRKYQPL